MSDIVQYIDRKSKKLIEEQTASKKTIRFLYQSNFLSKFLLHQIFKQRLFSFFAGKYMNSKHSTKRIPSFIKTYGIDMQEYEVPSSGFSCFNEFFYRRIKPEFRPIEKGIIAPADGKILVFPEILDNQKFFIKKSLFSIERFLENKKLATLYKNGAMVILRLALTDYHRYHFPVEGTVGENIKIGKYLYSVSPFALQKNLKIFLENKREYVVVETKSLGKIVIVDVGATMTGSIVQTHSPNSFVKKGQEKGYFAFGGSTLVLFFEKDKITFSKDLIENTEKGFETSIKMGETIALPC